MVEVFGSVADDIVAMFVPNRIGFIIATSVHHVVNLVDDDALNRRFGDGDLKVKHVACDTSRLGVGIASGPLVLIALVVLVFDVADAVLATVPIEPTQIVDGAVLQMDDKLTAVKVVFEILGGINPFLLVNVPIFVATDLTVRALVVDDRCDLDVVDGRLNDLDVVGELKARDLASDLIGVAHGPAVLIVLIEAVGAHFIVFAVPFKTSALNNRAVREGDGHVFPLRMGRVVVVILGRVNPFVVTPVTIFIIAVGVLDDLERLDLNRGNRARGDLHLESEFKVHNLAAQLVGVTCSPLVLIALFGFVDRHMIFTAVPLEPVGVNDGAVGEGDDRAVIVGMRRMITEILGSFSDVITVFIIQAVGGVPAVMILADLDRCNLDGGNGTGGDRDIVGEPVACDRGFSLIGVADRPLVVVALGVGVTGAVFLAVPLEPVVLDDRAVLEDNGHLIVADPGFVFVILGGVHPFAEFFVIVVVVGVVAVFVFQADDRVDNNRCDRRFDDAHIIGEVEACDLAFQLIRVADGPLVIVVLVGTVEFHVVRFTVPFDFGAFNDGAVLKRDGHVLVIRGRFVVIEILGRIAVPLVVLVAIAGGVIPVRPLEELIRLDLNRSHGALDDLDVVGEFVSCDLAFDLIGVADGLAIFVGLLRERVVDGEILVVPVESSAGDGGTVFEMDDSLVIRQGRGVIIEIFGRFSDIIAVFIINRVGFIIAVGVLNDLERRNLDARDGALLNRDREGIFNP